VPIIRRYKGTCYRIEGDAATDAVLVLVHGVGLDQGMWDPWRQRLSGRYCIITYDLLGHGGSHNPAGARKLSDFTDQLGALVRHLDIERWHLAGFSLGALIALHYTFTAESPGGLKPDSLSLLHSVFERSPAQSDAIEQRYLMTRDEGPMSTIEVAIQRWFSDGWIASRGDYLEQLRHIFRQHVDDGYLKAYRVFCDADREIAELALSSAVCRAMVLTGSLDTGSTPDMAKALARRLGAKLIVNQGHRHMAPVEYADLLSAQTDRFISET